jgi:hypothetical protein
MFFHLNLAHSEFRDVNYHGVICLIYILKEAKGTSLCPTHDNFKSSRFIQN